MEKDNTSHRFQAKGRKRHAAYAILLLAALTLTSFTAISPVASAVSYFPETLQGGGSTFVNPVMQVWATSFNQYTNNQVTVNYQAIGSGAGITGIENLNFEFAGSDAPLPPTQLAPYTSKYGPLIQMPESLGGVAIFYNIPGVSANLNMTGDIIARIYTGNITVWNDPAIQTLNPHVTLPGNTIVPVHRSDGSGTTYALTNFLEKTSANWNASWSNGVISSSGCPCYGTSISWPAFEIGAKGSGGVAAYVQQNSNSIGYADSYYAFSNNLKAAAVQNQARQFLVPTIKDISAAADAFSSQVLADPTFAITNAPGTGSYPISTFTYLFIWQDQNNVTTDQGQGFDTAHFFLWAVTQGQAFGPSLYYPKLPASVVAIDENLIEKIQFNGVPFITITSVGVNCTPSPVTVALSTKCVATIGTTLLRGTVIWSTDGLGRYAPATGACNVPKTRNNCSVRYFPTQANSPVTVTASFFSTDGGTIGSGSFSLSVNQKVSRTVVSCRPITQVIGANITCTAVVSGYYPTGTVTWSQTGGTIPGAVSFYSNTCTLTHTGAIGAVFHTARCSVTMKGTTHGSVILTASYGGDLNNLGSFRTKTINVK